MNERWLKCVTLLYTFCFVNTEKMKYRIAGGILISPSEAPHSVQFFNMGGMCGGTILSKKIIVTAAHCFDFNLDMSVMKIITNSRFVFDTHSQIHDVWRIILHERYNHTQRFEKDIALVMIKGEFAYMSSVQKADICLTDTWMNTNESLMVIGWGEQVYGVGSTMQSLSLAKLRYISDAQCHEMNNAHLTDDMFCLYGDGKRDTCRGDSGGGVFWNGLLVGITSHGDGCVKYPGVYVNVLQMKDWILNNVINLNKMFCTERIKVN